MNSRNAAKSLEKTSRRTSNLAVRYGAIGISAVAAAMQYRSETSDQEVRGEPGSRRSAEHDAKWRAERGPLLSELAFAR